MSQMVGYIPGPNIQGGVRQVAHARLTGTVIPERNEQKWISEDQRARMETVLDDWYSRLQGYLPPGLGEPRPDFEL